MPATLTEAERRILEAAEAAAGTGVRPPAFTDVVRRAVGHLTGEEFRRGVANLTRRRLLRGHVREKPSGELGRAVIEDLTPLGRSAIGRQ